MTEVLICLNEPWSRDDRTHVLIVGSHMTEVLVRHNEPEFQSLKRELLLLRWVSQNDMKANVFQRGKRDNIYRTDSLGGNCCGTI